MKTLAPHKDGVLREYIREKKRKPIGMVIGYINGDGVPLIGFSICHKTDEWNKEIGYLVAWARLSNKPLTLLGLHLPKGAMDYRKERDLRILKAVPYITKMEERLKERADRFLTHEV